MNNHTAISATRILKHIRLLRREAPQLVNPEEARKHGIDVLTLAQIRVVHDPMRLKSAGLSNGQITSVRLEVE